MAKPVIFDSLRLCSCCYIYDASCVSRIYLVVANKIRSRGRPRSFDKDEALETAISLFQAKGYDSVGVAELVAAMGIKPPSFYAAFGCKSGLLEQALARYSGGAANVFDRAREEGGSVADVIERTIRQAARRYTEKANPGCLALDAARNSADPDARALDVKAKAAAFESLRDYIAGEYPADADRLARFVTIALTGMSAAVRDGANRDDLEAFAAIIAKALRREMECDSNAG
ncbi:MAG: TetR/AcrR family transcriptional regulator [Tardiphaga sp.]